MNEHRLELADVFRKHEADFLTVWGSVLSPFQKKALRDIRDCRTAVLGGHAEEYDCGHRVILYNSCRSRSCPKCQAMARAHWLAEREKELLPVPYFHVVFTLPQQIGRLALQNPRQIYSILFRAVSETLLTIAADPKRLGAAIGFLAVLHTWGQNLHIHPHIHCVVPGGGIAPDGARWIASGSSFFLPVEVLSARFRNTFLIYLLEAFRKGQLHFHGELAPLAQPDAFEALCDHSGKIKWVVYAKKPFGGPEQVLKYLARYTHRVAISNSRLVSLEDGQVTFQWKDYADQSRTKTMKLDAVEFMRRFLLHVLPRGFVRIRQFGFLAHRVRKEKLVRCRSLLNAQSPVAHPSTPGAPEPDSKVPDPESHRCPICKLGRLVLAEVIPPNRIAHRMLSFCRAPQLQDTS
jgi:Putative transposase/Transposase zinc-binding domain